MSHCLLASIWTLLKDRTDVASIVNEAIGQHISCPTRLRPMGLATWTLTLLFKVVFDIQRLYLQAQTPSSTSKTYLLSPSQVIVYLQFVLSCSPRSGPSKHQPLFRRFVLITMLSGVRLLSLHRVRLLVIREDASLEERTEAFWIPSTTETTSLQEVSQNLAAQVNDHTDEFECFVIVKLLVETLAGLFAKPVKPVIPSRKSRLERSSGSAHEHASLDLPDVQRDGLVSIQTTV